jgi:hypothetical protein
MRYFTLGKKHKIVLLLGCQVTDHPTDAVHGHYPRASVFIRDTFQTANKFTASKTELGYEWVRHIFLLALGAFNMV